MKRTLMIFLSLCVITISGFSQGQSSSGFSQKPYNWKKGILKGSSYIIPGVASGLHEAILHHYPKFKDKFPGANDRFWNPKDSWERKYDDPYPGSRMFPVFTDAYHLTNAIKTGGLIGCTMFVTIGEKRPWWHYALDLGIGFAFYSVGSNGTFEYFNN